MSQIDASVRRLLTNAEAEADEFRERERRVIRQTQREARVKAAWDRVQFLQTEADRWYARTPTREDYIATLVRLTVELMRTLREEGLTHLDEQLAKGPPAREVAREVWRLAGAGETAAATALLLRIWTLPLGREVVEELRRGLMTKVWPLLFRETCDLAEEGPPAAPAPGVGHGEGSGAGNAGDQGGAGQGEEADTTKPPSPLQLDILQALRTVKATDSDKRVTGPDIASKVGGEATEQSVKAPLAALNRHGLVSSKTGRGGGTWLTPEGLDCINSLRPKR
jgi:hypothetical protein